MGRIIENVDDQKHLLDHAHYKYIFHLNVIYFKIEFLYTVLVKSLLPPVYFQRLYLN